MRGDTEAGGSGRPSAGGPGARGEPDGAGASGSVERLAARDVHAAVRRAAEPLAIVDRSGRLLFVNDAFDTLFAPGGRSDLHGRRWSDLLPPDEARRIERESRPYLRSGDAWRGRLELGSRPGRGPDGGGGRTSDGRPGAVVLSMTPLPEDRVLLALGPVDEPRAAGGLEGTRGGTRPDDADGRAARRGGRAVAGAGASSAAAPEHVTASAASPEDDASTAAPTGERDGLHDPLTGLASGALFHQLARRALAAARREERTGAIVVVEPGIPAGDRGPSGRGEVRRLRQVAARRLVRTLEEGDVAGLLADRRMAVAVDRVDGEADGVRLGRALVEALAPAVPVRGSRRSFSPSAGIALPSTPGEDTVELARRASEAAEAARRSPGPPVRVHRPGRGPTVPYRSRLTDELRRALARYALTLHYQPVLALDDDRPAGVQTLVRWPHPRYGLLDAARFVPLARDAGSVRRLDRWVLARAVLECEAEEAWPLAPISVHLAAETWSDSGFRGYVERVLGERPGRAASLLLHLEADVARTALDPLRSVVAELRELGPGIAVEGIRADNASTSYLEALAPDLVCVERSLAAGAAGDGTRLDVLRTLTDVAHTLGARVRAEGLERPSELAGVREAGCDEARGYLVGWPAATRPEARAAFDA